MTLNTPLLGGRGCLPFSTHDLRIDRLRELCESFSMKVIFLYSIILAILTHAEVTPWELKFKAYVKGLPSDVTELLQRTDKCNHWGGEEPYDKERANEIAAAMKEARCDFLEEDTKSLIKKYNSEPKIVDKIKNFSSL